MMELWTAVRQFLEEFFSRQTLQGASCSLAAIYAGAYSLLVWVGGVSHPSVPFLIVLYVIDFALGAGIAVWENHPSAQGFRRGFGKLVGYAMIFIITGVADHGMGIANAFLNLTLTVSLIAMGRETFSCLKHVDYLFPGLLPKAVLRRLDAFNQSVERDASGMARRHDDWRTWGESETRGERNGD